jgi:hypothetical protein
MVDCAFRKRINDVNQKKEKILERIGPKGSCNKLEKPWRRVNLIVIRDPHSTN